MATSSENLTSTSTQNSFDTDNDIVILEVRSPDLECQSNTTNLPVPEIFACALQASELPAGIVKIHVHRNRLMEHSTYFRSLFGGSFKESSLDYVIIQWNLASFIAILQVIYGDALNVSFTNFVPLLEGALFFGVESVITECKNWNMQTLKSNNLKFTGVFLKELINIWNFGAENGIHFILELYTDFFAVNFVAILHADSFVTLPYALLNACTSHPLLTVDSERQLCEAILNWLGSNHQCLEFKSSNALEDCFQILEKVRIGLLPLEFILGQLWRDYPSMVTSLKSTVMFDQILHNNHSDIQGGDIEHFRLRLTQYSEKLDLSGCQQVTGKMLYFSILHPGMVDPSLSSLVSSETLKRLVDMRQFSGVHCPVLQKSHLVASLNNLQEVNISRCWRFHEDDIIEWLRLSSPSVRIFKSQYCSQLKVSILDKLSQACSIIEEADLSMDISPVAAQKVSVLHVSCEAYPGSWSSSDWTLSRRPILSNLTRLSLKGHTDIRDNDLMTIAALSPSISVLNIDGCISLTDLGISCFLNYCTQLCSLHAAWTSFGQHSIKALLSISTDNDSLMLEHDFSLSLNSSSSLVELDIGGCKDIDQAFLINYMASACSLSCLSLRHTNLDDEGLYAFKGTSLKELDVCETLVSGAALSYIIGRNPDMHVLNARGCKRMSDCCGSELIQSLGRLLSLQELAVGWGLSGFSLEMMKPALASLKSLTVGLGGSLGTQAWLMLPRICPLLECISVCFQVVSDEGIMNVLNNLRYLHTLELRHCFGELSSNILSVSASNLNCLRLDRVASWMTDNDLAMLTRNCRSISQFSLAGCKLLTSDAQYIIASGWPGLTSIHMEDCLKVTASGVSYLLECKSVEDLLLRHNGSGIQRNFVLKAALKLPLLRTLSLDLCDACESGFDTPHHLDRFSLCTVKLSRCKIQKCALEIEGFTRNGPMILQPHHVHKETIVLEWTSIEFRTTIVEERI